jgi:hypothetical protein
MKSFWESRTLFSKRVLAVGDKKSSERVLKEFRMDILKVFVSFSFYVHPVDKSMG